MNQSYCNQCSKLVPACTVTRGGQVYLVKDCPACGETSTLVSGDARRYDVKRTLDVEHEYRECMLNCTACKHPSLPNMIFLDITNRCNLNCPICINNTPSMGFVFEPPIEYFEKIFKHVSSFDVKPAVQLFGGEPTVRKDLFEIIALCRKYGLPVRVVTNGIKLADEEFCRRLVESRATILIAYDNDNPELYRKLRGSEKALETKLKAIDNIGRFPGAKTVLMTLVARNFNDQDVPRLFEFCHPRRKHIRGIYFMPLAFNWDHDRLKIEDERLTSEEVEATVAKHFGAEQIEFIPAGFVGQLRTLMRALHMKRIPFAGAHPNCESLYLLVSDGEEYQPMVHFMKTSTPEMCRGLIAVEDRLIALAKRLDSGAFGRLLARMGMKEGWLSMRAYLMMGGLFRRHARLDRIVKGGAIGRLWHMAALVSGLALGRRSRHLLPKHTHLHEVLQLIVLPFEDKYTLETNRMERCPAAFAYVDPDDGKVKLVPTCAWGMHKTGVMRKIADQYKRPSPAAATSAVS